MNSSFVDIPSASRVERVAVLAAGGRGNAIAAVVASCLAAELPRDGLVSVLEPMRPPGAAATHLLDIASVGTTAAHALVGDLLRNALATRHLQVSSATAYDDPAALLASDSWRLTLVLSPWKRDLPDLVAEQSPSAARTGVVDTVLRAGTATIGVNTNSWAAQGVLELLAGTEEPRRIVVLGAGASARSVALAVRRAWGSDIDVLDEEAPGLRIVVNTTTWGETLASENLSFDYPLTALLRPGDAFFDLNNRTSALQPHALTSGCTVMSGTFMQRATNACRAALALSLVGLSGRQ